MAGGGVRNLRAMFETKDECITSPPDRGRSPAGSIGGGSNGTSPRPLSKVRTSFVAVERSGQLGMQLGLKKENYTEPIEEKRRESFSMDEPSNPGVDVEKTGAINQEPEVVKNIVMAEKTPQTEVEKKPTVTNSQDVGGEARDQSKGASQKKASVDDRKNKVLRSGTNGNATATVGVAPTAVDEKPKQTKAATKPASNTTTTRPASITTSKNSAMKPIAKPTRSPVVPKTPTTPGKPPMSSAKAGKPAPSKSTTPSTTTKSAESKANKPLNGSSNSARNALQPDGASGSTATTKKTNQATSNSTFHKPRPRSPTKPVKLPSSMTAPTASSLSKVSPASPPSQQSHRPTQAQNTKATSRPPSRINQASNIELRRKSSGLADRPAPGRLPAPSSVRRQSSRQSLPGAPAGEGFLARMMRPTTSSASKANDKAVSPPRSKSSTRPMTRDGPGQLRVLEGHKGSPPTKKRLVAPKAARVRNTQEQAPQHSLKDSNAEILTTVEPSADLVIGNDAKPDLEAKSEPEDFPEEDVKQNEKSCALKEPLEQPAATTDSSNKEVPAPEYNIENASKQDLLSSASGEEATPVIDAAAPEIAPAAQDILESAAEENRSSEEPKDTEEFRDSEEHKGAEKQKASDISGELDGTDKVSEEASAVAHTNDVTNQTESAVD